MKKVSKDGSEGEPSDLRWLKDPEACNAWIRRMSAKSRERRAESTRESRPEPPRRAEEPLAEGARTLSLPPGVRKPPEGSEEPEGRYDFDLAEFPLFRFEKPKLGKHSREPLVYDDEIRGPNGEQVPRRWKAYPGPHGWGGASAQDLLYDLLQLYIAQGCAGDHIEFGSMRSLLLRRGDRHPSARDFVRLRRDMDVLAGYQFKTENAFWDRESSCYVDMTWRLFDSVFYLKESPDQLVFPIAYVEVSTVLQQIARTRGFFALGFASRVFHDLKPLEKRLAVYLAKKFLSQQVHRRFVEGVCAALPIEASRADNRRARLKRVAEGLLEKRVPIIKSFRLEKGKGGEWLAVFERAKSPSDRRLFPSYAAEAMTPAVDAQVERIIEALGPEAESDRLWWARCAKVFGEPGVSRALGLLKDAPGVRSPPKLLSKIFKDLAEEQGLTLSSGPNPGS